MGAVTEWWQQRSDMRLMQLLGNCFPAGHDPYFVEDEELMKRLQAVLGVPQRTVDIVELLTRRPTVSPEDYYAKITRNPDALLVKRADIEDNTDPGRMELLAPDEREHLVQKYEMARRLLGI
jgi:hypothetical protein